jgi:hypothetical protein
MNALFDAPKQYGAEFEQAWKAYRYPRCSKLDAFKAWGQTTMARPDKELLIFAIEEYLCDIRKRKQLQLHFATFLRRCMWEPYMDDAKLRKKIADNPELIPKPRRSFCAAIDHPEPTSKPTRTAAQILAANRARHD